MFFGKKKIIGLDIGSTTIKAAELDVSRGGTTLVSFGIIPTPPSALSQGEIVDESLISSTIKKLFDEVKTKRKGVATGLWGTSVIVKRISVPQMDEKLVAEQIHWEAEQYIPYDVNEVNLEFKVISKDKNADTMDILLVAAVKDMVVKCAEIIQRAGLETSILDVEGFALANCFEMNYGVFTEQVTGLLNIGASVTNFVVQEEGETIFCRDIPVGGQTYTGEIAKIMGISQDEAEAMKMSLSSDQPVPEELNQIISSTHEIIYDEVNSSIDFFLNTSNSSMISQLYITGGGARTPGLLQKLSQNYSCERLDPLFTIKSNAKTLSADYIEQVRDLSSIAIGLGLRIVGDA